MCVAAKKSFRGGFRLRDHAVRRWGDAPGGGEGVRVAGEQDLMLRQGGDRGDAETGPTPSQVVEASHAGALDLRTGVAAAVRRSRGGRTAARTDNTQTGGGRVHLPRSACASVKTATGAR